MKNSGLPNSNILRVLIPAILGTSSSVVAKTTINNAPLPDLNGSQNIPFQSSESEVISLVKKASPQQKVQALLNDLSRLAQTPYVQPQYINQPSWQKEFSSSSLNTNDLMVTRLDVYNGGASGGHFEFINTVALTTGTVIYFTDKGWSSSNAFTTNSTADGLITWTLTSDIAAGHVFRMTINGGGSSNVVLSQVSDSNSDISSQISATGFTVTDPLSTAGDQIFIYTGSASSPSFVFGINAGTNSSTTDDTEKGWHSSVVPANAVQSQRPSGTGSQNSLTNSVSALTFSGSQLDIRAYIGDISGATKATWVSRVIDSNNWSGNNTSLTSAISTQLDFNPSPSVSSAIYNASSGQLVVTGTNLFSNSSGDDVDATKISFIGESSGSYTLTADTSNVEVDSETQFTLTVGTSDRTHVNGLLNKDGTSSDGGTTYNLSLADDFITGFTSGDTADSSSNTITVSGVSTPTISSLTYDAATGQVVITGSHFVNSAGGSDVDVSAFSFVGEGGTSYQLTDSSDVEITSSTQITFTLSATDKLNVDGLLNKDGQASDSTTYNLVAADNWLTGAAATTDIADSSSNGITVANVSAPAISTVTYDASTGVLAVTGTGFTALSGATNDVDTSKFTITGDDGSTYTLTTASVDVTSATAFAVTINTADKLLVNGLLNKNGTASGSGTTYNLAAADNWMTGASASSNVALATNAITVSNVTTPTVTSATYDTATGLLVVTGSNFVSESGSDNDIDLTKLTIVGEAGSSYTLTASAVDVTSASSFSATLTGADQLAVNGLLNKDGISSDDSTSYNISVADNWLVGADSTSDIADLTSNTITVSNLVAPTISAVTYDANTGTFVVTGTNFVSQVGSNNDVDVSQFTISGEAGATYTLTTSSVEVTSQTSFSIVLSAEDALNVNGLLNTNGASPDSGAAYNFSAADNWMAGAAATTDIADTTGNAITVSNLSAPTVTSATYDENTGVLVVTGTGFVRLAGNNNDIDVTKIQISGQSSGSYTLTADTSNIDITSATSFSVTLGSTDKTQVDALINLNGTQASSGTAYNIALSDNWMLGSASSTDISDTTGNAITALNINELAVFSNLNGGSTYTENGSAVTIDSDVVIADSELDALNSGNGNYNGATLTIQNSAGASSLDNFSFLDGNNLEFVGGVQIHKNSQFMAGFTVNTGVLTVNFSDTSVIPTSADIDFVLQQIQYSNSSEAPVSSVTLDYTFNDGEANSTGTNQAVITLQSQNDAPVLDNSASPTLTTITEDAGDDDSSAADGDDDLSNNSNNSGDAVADVVTDNSITDVDATAVEAIAVSAVDNTNGNWQYSVDNGSTWQSFSATTGQSVNLYIFARLLDGTLTGSSTHKIRFVPNLNYNGTASLTYGAWDKSAGSAGGTLDLNETNSVSSATETVSVTISAVDDVSVIGNLSSDSVDYDRSGNAMLIDDSTAQATITDVDSSSFDSGSITVSISSGKVTSQDLLTLKTDGTDVVLAGTTTGSNVSVDGAVVGTLANDIAAGANLVINIDTTRNPSLSELQSIIRTVAYQNTAGNDAVQGSRNVRVTLVDKASNSIVSNSTMVVPANQVATVTSLPTTLTITEDQATAVDLSAVVISDPEGYNVTVSLFVDSGTIASTDGNGVTDGVTVSNSGTQTLTLAGTATAINSYLDNTSKITITTASNSTSNITLTVTANDGVQDGVGANSTITVTPTNDSSSITGSPTDVTVSEDVLSSVNLSSITISDGDSASITVTFTITAGVFATPASGTSIGGGVVATKVSDTVVTLVGSASDISTYLDTTSNLQYTGASNVFGDNQAILTITSNDGDGSGDQTLAQINLDITAVNDPTVIDNLAGDSLTYNATIGGAALVNQSTGATVSDVDTSAFNGATLTVSFAANGVSAEDSLAIQNVGSASGQIATTGSNVQYGGSTFATFTGGTSASDLVVTFTAAATTDAIAALINAITYSNSAGDNATVSTRTVRFVINDGTDNSSNYDVSVAVGVNSAPTLAVANSTYTENTTITLDASATASDPEGDGDWDTNASLAIQISANGESTDSLSILTGTDFSISNGTLSYQNTAIATITETDGGNDGSITGSQTLTLAFNSSASNAAVQSLLRALSFTSSSQTPSADARTVSYVLTDKYGASVTDTATITITALDDAPTLTASQADTTTQTENGSAVSVFKSTSINTIESSQSITQFAFTVTNVANGTSEIINLDGSDIPLVTTATGTTTNTSLNYAVALSDTTATVTVSGMDASASVVQTLIDAVTYRNTSDDPTGTTRVVTLTTLVDSGSATGSNVNTNTAVNQSSTVTLVAVNDEPTLTANASTVTYTENASAASLFNSTDSNTVEAGQVFGGFVLQATNISDASAEKMVIDGATIAIGTASSGALNAIGNYAVAISNNTATMTVTDTSLSQSAMNELVNGIGYLNSSEDPTVAERVFSLTSLTDRSADSAADAVSSTTNLPSATLVLTAVNDKPTLTATGSNPTFTEGGAGAALFSGSVISAVEAGQLISQLVLTVTNVTDTTESVTFDGSTFAISSAATGTTATNTIAYSSVIANNQATITLSKTGGIAAATWQSLVDAATYSNSSENPTSANARVVTITQLVDTGGTADGGVDTSALSVASTVNVVGVNDAPTLVNGAANLSVNEDTALTIAGLSVADVDNTTLTYQLSTTNSSTLSLSATADLTGDTTGTDGSLSLVGTATAINTAINNLSFTPQADFNGTVTLVQQVSDSATSTSDTFTVAVSAVNDGPIVTTTSTTQSVAEEQTLTISAADISVTDVDGDELTITVAASNGSFSFGTGVTANGNTYTGTAANFNAAAAGATYVPNNDFFGTDVVTFSTTDGAENDNDSITIAVSNTNDAPVNSIPTDGLTVAEDNTTTLTGASVADADSSVDTLSLQLSVASGTLSVASGATLTDTDASDTTLSLVGSQAQINQALTQGVLFNAGSDANGTFAVTQVISDGTASDTDTFTITVSNVNDAPVNSLPTSVTTNEDTNFTFSASNKVSVSDADSSDTLTVTLAAATGSLSLATTTDVTFTAGDGADDATIVMSGTAANVNAALDNLVYQPAANANGATSIVVTTEDGTTSDIDTISVAINAQNDAPVNTVSNANTAEDTAVTLTNEQISVADIDSNFLTLTLTASNGLMSLPTGADSTVTVVSDSTTNVASMHFLGSLTQVNSVLNAVTYTPSSNFNGTGEVVVNTSDGVETVTSTVSVAVAAVNDAPTLTTNIGATLAEAASVTVTSEMLSASDVDTAATGLTYTVTSLPTNGSLTLNGTALTAGQTFTQDDIDNNRVAYSHNGSETTADNVVATLSDGGADGAASQSVTFALTVTPVNDAPTLTTNTGVSVNEAAAVTISSEQLSFSDVDDTAAELTYTVQTIPANGSLTLNGTAIAANGTFTQADVNAGNLLYSHAGGENTADSFVFSLADGGENDSAAINGTVAISVTPVNDTPVQLSNTGASLAEGGNVTFTTEQLAATDADHAATALSYTVSTLPSNGSLALNDSALTAGQTFTQDDIDNGRVAYSHNGGESTADSFVFALSDGTATLSNATFSLTVAAVNDAPTLTTNTGVSVNEAAAVTISSEQLSFSDVDDAAAELTYTVQTIPTNGSLTLNGTAIAASGTFTQADVNAGNLLYSHAGGENTADSFVFSLADGGEDNALAVGGTFTLSITPVNDAPTLTTNTGVSVNEAAAVTISSEQLSFSDVDDAAAELTYTVQTIPTNGSLTLNGTAIAANGTFTQADVNAGNLLYSHAGGESSSDSFVFSLADGGENDSAAINGTIAISVTPVNDTPVQVANTGASLAEGGNVTLTTEQLAATDADHAATALSYTVSTLPSNGSLALNDTALTAGQTFTQDDIDNGRVAYSHNGDESTADSFVFALSDGTATLSNATFALTVSPVNDAPTSVAISSAAFAHSDGANAVVGSLTTTDVDAGDSHTYSICGTSGFSIDGSNLIVTDPATFTQGTTTVCITTTDTGNATFDQTITLTVTDDVAPDPADNQSAIQFSWNTLDINAGSFLVDYQVTVSESVIGATYNHVITSSGTTLESDVSANAEAGTVSEVTGTGTITSINQSISDIDVSGLADGTLTLSVTLTDPAGNTSAAATATLLKDTVAPAPTITAGTPQAGTGQFEVTVTFSEDVSNFTVEDLIVANGVASNFAGSGSVYTATITPSAREVTINVAENVAQDGLGNNNTAATPLTVQADVTAPTLSSFSPVDNATDVALDSHLTLTFSENVSALAGDANLISVIRTDTNETFASIAANSSQVVIADNVVTIDLGNDLGANTLRAGTAYHVLVSDAAFADGFSNVFAGISDTSSFNFTTANQAPVSSADSASVTEDGSVVIDVLANDTDADSTINLASVEVVTQPQSGSTSINVGTGRITYTPNSDFAGDDSFVYQVRDLQGLVSNQSTVSVTVTPVNDAPVASNDVVSTGEDVTLVFDVRVNDTDVEDTIPTGNVTLASQSANGASIVVLEDGQIQYTPAANFNGSDNFTYQVADSEGLMSDVATVVVSVSSNNDQPVAGDDSATTDEDNSVIIPVLANDSDVEDSAFTASQITIINQGSLGSATVNDNGEVVYVPNADANGTDTVTYTLVDSDGLTANEASITVVINPQNDAPVANSDTAVLLEGGSFDINVLGNDTDVDAGDSLAASSLTITTQPSSGSIVVNTETGLITYTPDADFAGVDLFAYTVADSAGVVAAPATVAVTVTSVNDAPIANADVVTTNEDTQVVINVLSNDVDIDGTIDETQVTLLTQPSKGSATVNSDGTITYLPNANETGADSLTYQVVDNEGSLSAAAEVTINITSVNDLPVTGDDIVDGSTNEDASYQFTLDSAAFSDVDQGDTLTYTITGLPEWLTFDADTLVLSGTPANDDVGSLDITVTATDGVGESVSQTFTLVINNTNDAPVTAPDSYSVAEGSALVVDVAQGVLTNDSDVDVDDSLTVNLVDNPAFASDFTFNTDGSFTYTHNGTENFADSFTYTVTDNTVTSDPVQVTLNVTPVNDAPEFLSQPSVTEVSQGEAFSYSVITNDPDSSENLTLTQAPNWLSLNDNNELVGEAPFGSLATETVLLTTSDGEFDVTQSFDLTVSERATSLVGLTGQWSQVVVEAGEAVDLTVTANHISGPALAGTFLLDFTGNGTFSNSDGLCSVVDATSFSCDLDLAEGASTSFNFNVVTAAEGDITSLVLVNDTAAEGAELARNVFDISVSPIIVDQPNDVFNLANATTIAADDVNASVDGIEMIAGTSEGDNVKIIRLLESGAVDGEVIDTIDNTGTAKALILNDFNNDDALDILVINEAGQASAVYNNLAGLGFEQDPLSQTFGLGIGAQVIDFNLDDFADIVMFSSSQMRFYANSAEGFTDEVILIQNRTDEIRSVLLGDIDGDGTVDLIVGEEDRLAIVRNLLLTLAFNRRPTSEVNAAAEVVIDFSEGSEQVETVPMENVSDLAIADVNNDGTLDIIVANRAATESETAETTGAAIQVISIDAESDQPVVVAEFGSASSHSIEVTDTNNDGTPDLLVGNENGVYQIYEGVQDSSDFTLTDTVIVEATTLVVPADVNGDGLVDVLAYDDKVEQVNLYLATENTIGAVSDISINLNVSSLDLIVGEVQQVTATVSNAGPGAAENVIVSFKVGDKINLTRDSALTCEADSEWQRCNIGTVEAGQSISFDYQLEALEDLFTEIMVEVASDGNDQNTDNNSASAELDAKSLPGAAVERRSNSGGGSLAWLWTGLIGLAAGMRRRRK